MSIPEVPDIGILCPLALMPPFKNAKTVRSVRAEQDVEFALPPVQGGFRFRVCRPGGVRLKEFLPFDLQLVACPDCLGVFFRQTQVGPGGGEREDG